MNEYKNRLLILLRHPEDNKDSSNLTRTGRLQAKEIAELLKDNLLDQELKIGIFSSPANRTTFFAKEIKKALELEDEIDVDSSLLSPDSAAVHLESCELPIMVVVTHKEVISNLVSWAGDKFGIDIQKEHLQKPRFASGWVMADKKIKKIGPKKYCNQ